MRAVHLLKILIVLLLSSFVPDASQLMTTP
jgi:hypothetical protein